MWSCLKAQRPCLKMHTRNSSKIMCFIYKYYMMSAGKGFLRRALKLCWISSRISWLLWSKRVYCFVSTHTHAQCLELHYLSPACMTLPNFTVTSEADPTHFQMLHMVKLTPQRLMDVLLPQKSIALNHVLPIDTDFRVMQVSSVRRNEGKSSWSFI